MKWDADKYFWTRDEITWKILGDDCYKKFKGTDRVIVIRKIIYTYMYIRGLHFRGKYTEVYNTL